jgi:hypothetical protein
MPHLFPGAAAAAAARGGARSPTYRGSGGIARPITGLVDVDVWSRRWATVTGVLLLLGVFCPLLLPTGLLDAASFEGADPESIRNLFERRMSLVWPWDAAMEKPGYWGLGVFLAIGLGGFAIVAARALHGPGRGMALFFVGIGAILLLAVLDEEGGLLRLAIPELGMSAPVAVFHLALASATAIAVGAHVRKRFPASGTARVLAGVGGVGLLASFLIPVLGNPLVSVLFQGQVWRFAWPSQIVLLAMLGYAILGLSCSSTSASVVGRCALLGLLGRVIVVGLPLAFVITFTMHGSEGMFGMMATMWLKAFLWLYGQALMIVVGLAAWIDATHEAKTPQPLDPARLAQVFR